MDNSPKINDNGKVITLTISNQVVTFDNWSQLAQLALFLIRNVPLKNFLSPQERETFRKVYFQ